MFDRNKKRDKVTRARRPTVEVRIGRLIIGGVNPVAVQTMTDAPTMDTVACVRQICRVHEAGCRIVRLTARTAAEAENFSVIREALHAAGICDAALVADVHFSPAIALVAAEHADKVRINPGNFNDPDGILLERLVGKCRERGISLRIGVNHGSLSPAITEHYGDTPEGMVESAMQMLRRCREMNFDQVVVSMKSSNVRVMVYAYRLLARRMQEENMHFPLHLGVTEAGDGAQGRIKSAVGIASLLADGIGDTLRVSLTEPPENEIPVALAIAETYTLPGMKTEGGGCDDSDSPPTEYCRRLSSRVGNIGGGEPPLLYSEFDAETKAAIENGRVAVYGSNGGTVSEIRSKITAMDNADDRRPVVVHRIYNETSLAYLQLKAAADTGALLLDGLVDGVWLENTSYAENGNKETDVTRESLTETALSIMQAARARISGTEYIACPGCGRTLFDLQSTLRSVRARTSHLKGLKIGVMGCIVNGPGEMADADYGYVGAGTGRVVLYKGREPMGPPMPQEDAVEALVSLIQEYGDWQEP